VLQPVHLIASLRQCLTICGSTLHQCLTICGGTLTTWASLVRGACTSFLRAMLFDCTIILQVAVCCGWLRYSCTGIGCSRFFKGYNDPPVLLGSAVIHIVSSSLAVQWSRLVLSVAAITPFSTLCRWLGDSSTVAHVAVILVHSGLTCSMSTTALALNLTMAFGFVVV
jgi:hypothetical protein